MALFGFANRRRQRDPNSQQARVRKRTGGGGFAGWYDRVAAFNVENLFAKRREPGPPRAVLVNQDLPQDYYDAKGRVKKEHVYATNQVVTSKYTIVTFLPRNLLEQFRRIANVCVCLLLAADNLLG